MFSKIKNWLPLAIAISSICLLVYTSVQQSIRRGANYPQIQIAQDLKDNLNTAKQKEEEVSSSNIDPSKSLSNFAIIFNDEGHPVASSASLDGRIPIPPQGVFDYVRSKGEDRFTWEPRRGVRIATVVLKYGRGFVLVGRSLKEVESLEDWIFKMVFITWIGTLFITFAATLILGKSNKSSTV